MHSLILKYETFLNDKKHSDGRQLISMIEIFHLSDRYRELPRSFQDSCQKSTQEYLQVNTHHNFPGFYWKKIVNERTGDGTSDLTSGFLP